MASPTRYATFSPVRPRRPAATGLRGIRPYPDQTSGGPARARLRRSLGLEDRPGSTEPAAVGGRVGWHLTVGELDDRCRLHLDDRCLLVIAWGPWWSMKTQVRLVAGAVGRRSTAAIR